MAQSSISLQAKFVQHLQQSPLPPHGDDDYGLTLSNRRLQEIAILTFKAVNGMLPRYISELFVVSNNIKCLRGTNRLVVPREKTANFCLKSTTFIGVKVWNSLYNGKIKIWVMPLPLQAMQIASDPHSLLNI